MMWCYTLGLSTGMCSRALHQEQRALKMHIHNPWKSVWMLKKTARMSCTRWGARGLKMPIHNPRQSIWMLKHPVYFCLYLYTMSSSKWHLDSWGIQGITLDIHFTLGSFQQTVTQERIVFWPNNSALWGHETNKHYSFTFQYFHVINCRWGGLALKQKGVRQWVYIRTQTTEKHWKGRLHQEGRLHGWGFSDRVLSAEKHE